MNTLAISTVLATHRYGKSKPEVAVGVRPGVYKISMVRMSYIKD